MTTWKYVGETPGTYPDYLAVDAEGQLQTLVAEPGKEYEIKPADGTEYTVPAEQEGGEPTVKKLPVPPPGPWEKVKAARPAASTKSEE